MSQNSFGARDKLEVGGSEYEIFRLEVLQREYDVARLPFSLKVLLENLLRTEGNGSVSAADVEALARWDAKAEPSKEISFTPARVLMQDLTGVPAVVDLAAMRDAMAQMGGDPARINPLAPAELVIDHSVQVDAFGTREAFRVNADREFERNQERYLFLRWGQGAFRHFAVVPPDTGIVHQVNLEYLARVVFDDGGRGQAYPDTLLGTDSHTTMVNGLGVLGWGVGGIEAEAAMLGQPVSMLIPQVLGFRLHGELPAGTTATDLVLTVTERLRQRGVVGMFVEFYGAGLASLPIADRATIGNMSPEFGSTCAIFPIDEETLGYLRLTGRPEQQIALVEAYAREQGLWHDEHSEEPTFSDHIELDLARSNRRSPAPAAPRTGSRCAVPASPSARPWPRSPTRPARSRRPATPTTRPSRRATRPRTPRPTALPAIARRGRWSRCGRSARRAAPRRRAPAPTSGRRVQRSHRPQPVTLGGGELRARPRGRGDRRDHELHQHLQPLVMVGAGVLARNAVARGLRSKPWVKTSLAPGSKVVTEYLDRAGLTEPLEALGFNLVGYGCTTCIGNSGPLPEPISKAVGDGELAVVSVLSGNRNFEGRINPDVKMNYLASPPLWSLTRSRGRWTSTSSRTRWATTRMAGRSTCATSGPRAGGRRDDRPQRRAGHVSPQLRRGLHRRRRWRGLPGARRRALRVGGGLDLRAPAALLR